MQHVTFLPLFRRTGRCGRVLVGSALLLAVLLLLGVVAPAQAQTTTQVDIPGPAGSGAFGRAVYILPNGNLLIADPLFDLGATPDVGAVYLYHGRTLEQISALTGAAADDKIGSGGIIVLPSGNFVVNSPYWDNGAAVDAGAVTWGSQTVGVAGLVASANSLIGGGANDRIGIQGVRVLVNGNYVVLSYRWQASSGAATWGSGTTGVRGVVSGANSLVGTTPGDAVGYAMVALTNGNYVLITSEWSNGAVQYVGAVTWANGLTGISGVISSANSLVGQQFNDEVGSFGVTPLTNGHYVVNSPSWSNGAISDVGAATWGNGATGITGLVSTTNSLTGASPFDYVSRDHTYALQNGNYLVQSSNWMNGSLAQAGAVTWGNGAGGVTGVVSWTNSLVGGSPGDYVGQETPASLANGNYLLRSPSWSHGASIDAGAVTWGNGAIGSTGVVSHTNSLVGSHSGDYVGAQPLVELTNGHYVVVASNWDNGALVDAGAVTWGNGAGGTAGVMTTTNSLFGATAFDAIGNTGVYSLAGGNYLVVSKQWQNGGVGLAGAVTWLAGAAPAAGAVSAVNSLVGSSTGDSVGENGITVPANGNYVVNSPNWDNGFAVDAGAVTWGSAANGVTGPVSGANSLVGDHASDRVGSGGVAALTNGHFVVNSPEWDSAPYQDVGAATWANGLTGIKGFVTGANSLVGGKASDRVGANGTTPLPNGNYVVASPYWSSAALPLIGAVTQANGAGGTVGEVTGANSLIGGNIFDQVGNHGITAVAGSSRYVVLTKSVDDGLVFDVGAVTFASGSRGVQGVVTKTNSVFGATVDQGFDLVYATGANGYRLVVGRSVDQKVTVMDVVARLTVSPNGNGFVVSSIPGINCGANCTEDLIQNSVVTLTAVPATHHSLAGWSGACSGAGACVVTMDGAKAVTATFQLNSYPLAVTVAGHGVVNSAPSGIHCGGDCGEPFLHGTVVTLTTTATVTGTSFSGWSGVCSGAGACVITLASAASVTATYIASSEPTLQIDPAATAGRVVALSARLPMSSYDDCVWSFGDGTQESCAAALPAVVSGAADIVRTASHTYAAAGVYAVAITATNSAGSFTDLRLVATADALTTRLFLPLIGKP